MQRHDIAETIIRNCGGILAPQKMPNQFTRYMKPKAKSPDAAPFKRSEIVGCKLQPIDKKK
jgi:hypothetical protein